MAPLKAVLKGESRKKRCQLDNLNGFYEYSLGGMAIPYPFESSIPPIWVSSQFLSITYSIEVDSIRKA